MSKFKVGDRVVGIDIVDGKDIRGKAGIVKHINEYNNLAVEFDDYIDGHSCQSYFKGSIKKGHGWWCSDRHLKLEENWKVLIMPEGDKTTGRLYKNGEVVKSVETKKHPDDEYSIDKACEVIMERLFEPVFLKKFEKGKTYIFSEELHDKKCGKSLWCMDLDGKNVTFVDEFLGRVGIYDIDPAWCKEVKEPPKPIEPTYYNGKVVCIESANGFITKGKIYEFKDGYSVDDEGDRFPKTTQITSLEHLNETMWSDFIEVVE